MSDFHIDWERCVVTSSLGKSNCTGTPRLHLWDGKPAIQIRFSKSDCLLCSTRVHCAIGASWSRSLTLLPNLRQESLQSARQRQATYVFKAQYALRSGIEGAIALGKNTSGPSLDGRRRQPHARP